MQDLAQEMPNVELLLALEPEELAGRLLFVLRRRLERSRQPIHLGNCLNEFDYGTPPFGRQAIYPEHRIEEVKIAISEAWLWLQAQALIIPSTDGNGHNGFSILSRRARSFEDQRQFARYQTSRILPKEILHPRFANPVWSAFIRGEYDSAVFQAMKAVEVYVREAAGSGNDQLGVRLMRDVFKPDNGVLTDLAAEAGERTARMELFAGAIGSYKNPNSHRDVNMEDPVEAVEIIMLANHLMKIVDARVATRNSGA